MRSCQNEYRCAYTVGGNYDFVAPRLIHDFQTSTTFGGLNFFTTFTTFTTFEAPTLAPGNVPHNKKEVFCSIFCLFFDLFLHWTDHRCQKMEFFLHRRHFRRRPISATDSHQKATRQPLRRFGVLVVLLYGNGESPLKSRSKAHRKRV